MEKIILALSGEMGCGKGTIAKYLKETHNASVYRFSDPLRSLLSRIYRDTTRENMQAMSGAVRAFFGQDILSEVVGNDIKNEKNNLVVVDGVRRESDLKNLSDIPGFFLLYVDADLETRYERVVLRSENAGDRDKTFDQFKHESASEAESSILGLKYIADVVMKNNGSPEELYDEVEKILRGLRKS